MQKNPFGIVGRPPGQLGTDIAAQQAARFPTQPRFDRRTERPDGGDGPDAEQKTGKKHAKPAHAAAQFAVRNAQSAGDGSRPQQRVEPRAADLDPAFRNTHCACARVAADRV